MGEDCTQCQADFGELQCCKGCHSDACFEMAGTNCKAAYSACLKCPGRYACFATQHCLENCIRIEQGSDKPLTREQLQRDIRMAEEDHWSGDDHCGGCLWCPCCLSGAILGCVGMILTWFGSTACCMAGVCCLPCELCKNTTNSVSPS